MIAVLGDQHLGEQSLGGHATGQWPLWRRRLHHCALTAAAAVTRATDHLDAVERRDDVEHLRDVLADQLHRAAAARAALVLDIDDDLEPRQMRRHGAAVALRRLAVDRRLLAGWRLALDARLSGAERLLDLFQPELQLIRIELLRMCAVAAARQLLDEQLQLLDPGIGRVALCPERIALDAQPLHRAVLRLQHRHQDSELCLELDGIMQRLGGVEEHALMILAVIGQTQSCPINPSIMAQLLALAGPAISPWHAHPLGQTLIVTAGYGRVQREGGPVEEIRPSDVVWIPPGVKHWHGAAPTTAMTHIAIQEKLDSKVVEWMEKVTDEQYLS
jgi:quercetin dioxygenase-like cupin family protein